VLSEYQPSGVMRWRKNPNWYRKDVPYMEGYDTPIITEYAARLAQFKAKNVWDLVPNAPDLVDMAKNMADVQLYEGPRAQQVWHIDLGARPGSPFFDRRVRQAMSISIDRDLFAQVHSENDMLSSAGLPRSLTVCTIVSDYWGETWLDPKGSKLGAGGKFYQKDLAEAKKLMQAAGYSDGLDTALNSRGGTDPGEQILSGMLSEVGIRSKVTSWTSPNYLTQVAYPYDGLLGNFDGWASRGSVGFNPSIMSFLQKMWHTQGRNPGARTFDGDEQVKIDKLVDEGLRTFDEKKIRELVWEMQRLHAAHMSAIPFWYNSNPLSVAWPWVKNRNVFQYREGNSALLHVWIDEAKKA
jgi:ABC-type transport system substrate-binding protein